MEVRALLLTTPCYICGKESKMDRETWMILTEQTDRFDEMGTPDPGGE